MAKTAKRPAPRAPKLFDDLAKRHPEVFDALDQLGLAVRAAGPLDARTSQLVQLAAAAAARSEGAVHSHARRALAAGATAEELEHALMLLISTIGTPQVVAALSWVRDVSGPGRRRSRHRARSS
jgi:4-carboxymuconolactone decarboxylase